MSLLQLLRPMMLRRMKEDVEKSLAPKEETIVEVGPRPRKKWRSPVIDPDTKYSCVNCTVAIFLYKTPTMHELFFFTFVNFPRYSRQLRK
jgi:hypothetical protein